MVQLNGVLKWCGAGVFLAGANAWATNGIFLPGHGSKAIGMGGASMAMTQEAMGGVTNPATMVFTPDMVQGGIAIAWAPRSVEREGSLLGILDGKAVSAQNPLIVPDGGINWHWRDNIAIGLSMSTTGLITDYPDGQINPLSCGVFARERNMVCGEGRLGTQLMQIFVAPTLSWRFLPRHAIGIAPTIVYQRLKNNGVQALRQFSAYPNHVSNRGYANSFGIGVRVGYYFEPFSWLSLGASYQPQIHMSALNKYKGLVPNEGKLEIPENFSLGLALKPTKKLAIAFDYERIDYSDSAYGKTGEPIPPRPLRILFSPNTLSPNQPGASIPTPFGSENGPFLGWHDINIYKLGAQYAWNDKLSVRAGLQFSPKGPIREDNVTINFTTPLPEEMHYMAGFSYRLTEKIESTFFYMHTEKETISGPSFFNGVLGLPIAGTDKLTMHEDTIALGLAYSF